MEAQTQAPTRLRPQITMTVHPDTVKRLGELTAQFRQSRGQLIDRMVMTLAKQYSNGQVYCMTGEPCRFNRTDVPDIF